MNELGQSTDTPAVSRSRGRVWSWMAVAVLAGSLALTGCSAPAPAAAPAAAPPTPTSAPLPTIVASIAEAQTLPEAIDFVLAQQPGAMISNDILNSAKRLLTLAHVQYSDAALGNIPVQLLKIALESLDYKADEVAPELQSQLVEYAKQIRELG